MYSQELYIIRAAAQLRERLDLIASALIAAVVPAIAAVAAAIVGVIAVVIIALAHPGPAALAAGLLVLAVLLIAAVWVGAAVGVGGLAHAVLDAQGGVKRGLLDPFKQAWAEKWRFMLLILVVALISLLISLAALAPLIPMILGILKNPGALAGGEQAFLGLMARVYTLLVPVAVAAAAIKLLLEPSYLYAASEWRGVWDALSRSLRGAYYMASTDPVSTIAFFLAFFFPDVLLYVFPEAFLGNPLASNLFSLLVGAKNLVVEPFFLLAAADAGRDAGLLAARHQAPPPPPPAGWAGYPGGGVVGA